MELQSSSAKLYILIKGNKFSDRNRFARDVTYIIDSNECWLCASHKPNGSGYPGIFRGGKTMSVSQLVHITFNGVIPKGHVVRHTCDNKMCINPSHLIAGTYSQNSLDAMERGQIKVGEKSFLSKLTDVQALAIFNSPLSNYKTAAMYSISPDTVRDIKRKRTWKHIHKVNSTSS